ncbi:hypothetical protein [Microcoleus sp. FACHB-68]|nr:hypothetical protein [Microcoleus sp. FACHB-68]
MLIIEANILNTTKKQYLALDDGILAAHFVSNTAIEYWQDSSK